MEKPISNNRQVSVALSVECWEVIKEFIKSSCQQKGDDWIKWGQEINQFIQSSIGEKVAINPINGIKRIFTSSTDLISVGYDEKTGTLEIQFNNGFIYQYYQVPQAIYISLMKSKTLGIYFYSVIHNAFQFREVGYKLWPGYKKMMYGDNCQYDCGDYNNEDNDPADYGDNVNENYDPANNDLKSILDMDFMSDDEFDTWLEDERD
jgi:hypothetical protein